MKCLLVLALCFVAAMASIPDGYANGRYAFYGRYNDKCGNDGFYYKDDNSFVICSNGNSYEQPCAPGSRNSGYDHYNHGTHYYYRDFCDVNLVDYGAGIPHGYDHRDAGYGYGHDGAYGKGHDSAYGYGDAGYGYGHDAGFGYGHGDGYRFENDGAYGKGYDAGYGHDSHY